MNHDAIIQAETRLDRARRALEAMKTTKDPAEIEERWENFLIAASGVYSKLEQGAKEKGKSDGWFGRKKH